MKKSNQVIRYLEHNEVVMVFDQIINRRDKIMFKLMYDLCLRVGEVVSRQAKHLDLNNSTLFIDHKDTKEGKKRLTIMGIADRGGGTLKISPNVINDIKSWLRERDIIARTSEKVLKPESYLFGSSNSNSKHITENRVRQLFNKYIEPTGLQKYYRNEESKLKLKQYTVHSLRHSGIMHLIHDLNLSLDTVMVRSRHASIAGLSAYAKPSEKLVNREIDEARKRWQEQHKSD
jgi:integrase